MKKTIEQIAKDDGRYSSKAIEFVHRGLGSTIEKLRQDEGAKSPHRHITGQELCAGLAQAAIEKYGRLARTVLGQWSITSTSDFGEIVFLMIENNWMSKQPEDSIDDFCDVYDFETVFEKQFKFKPSQPSS